jgi:simple sugar transport system permease protein
VFRGAILFGFPSALKFRDEKNVPALLLVIAVILVALAVVALLKNKQMLATGLMIGAAVSAATYFLVDEVPQEFVAATPYIVTILVLAGAQQQLRPPAYAGIPYRAGENH